MFDWFKKDKLSANVVPFPSPGLKPVPYVEPPKQEKDPTTYYSIGHTDDNRVTLSMGYTKLTMSYLGVQHLIDQLELYQSQLNQDNDEQSET
jgi:hypothetical protein